MQNETEPIGSDSGFRLLLRPSQRDHQEGVPVQPVLDRRVGRRGSQGLRIGGGMSMKPLKV
jgi:hypothetical protein